MTKIEPVPLVYNLVEPDGDAIDKPPVIFLHGLSASKEIWHDIPKTVANATKRKVYAVDSRNHGESPWSDVFNFDCNVDDLLHFMDTIRAPKAILIGHSMGGFTSIKTALKAKKVPKFDENGYMIPLKKTEDGRYTFKSNIEGLQNTVKSAEQLQSSLSGKFEGPICFIYGKISPFQV
ncbi:unnamed protein product [Larinioides sclopetarius]|uniref:sn-1-specific diacylglycerol lipase ABHD11 n=1 Tax=Larinioides sclopetarius TaxID=280406 RepID=A0AAV2A4C8_9ARAC